MKVFAAFLLVSFSGCLALGTSTQGKGQSSQQTPPAQSQGSGQDANAQQEPGRGQRRPGLFGKIAAIHDQSIEIATPQGNTVTVKISADTQLRKEREAAKLSDFKVGDLVVVRGEEGPDHTWTAQMVRSAPNGAFFEGQNAGGGAERIWRPGGGQGAGQLGVLGQDYVVGEIKSVDPPNLTILRPDNVTQAIELTEETSLRKGRDSITMADIQPGDHVFVHGATANNAFHPKSLVVIPPEAWKRMQEMGFGASGQPAKPPQDKSKPQNPPEPRH